MKMIHANQANRMIRKILPENIAAKFFKYETAISIICAGDATKMAKGYLDAYYTVDSVTRSALEAAYRELQTIGFIVKERKNSYCTVTSTRSLLLKMIYDGMAKFKIYPKVEFT